ncbi:MAG: 2'-5' RNA ligase family protein [Clostridium sp.]|nr:2'-5' RNA ligase family protein [Clostridium sp.]
MKYYLVALFDRDSCSFIENIQKDVCRKYKLHKKLSELHITIEIINNPDIDKLDKIVSEIIKPYKEFKAYANGVVCFDSSYKSINFKIENKGYLVMIAKKINDRLKLSGFDIKENAANSDLHISIANTNYASRKWSSNEYKTIIENIEKILPEKMIKIDRFELWKSINNKKSVLFKSYKLKEY